MQMSKFKKTRWADSEFAQNYRDDANIYLPFRSQFIDVAKSLYGHFFDENIQNKILDLGCGDGFFVQEFLKSFSQANMTLLDASVEMLGAAKKRLGSNTNLNYIQASFQDLLAGKSLNEKFNFIYSSLAIHHLPLAEKKNLYSCIHKLLSSGGCFIHYDVVAPPSENLEKWYLSLWRQWINVHPSKERSEKLSGIPEEYKANPDNTPDTLTSQLEILEEIGFKEVDCYFKYGIFSLFGGFK